MATARPLNAWEPLPPRLTAEVNDSFAPQPVKTLFALWGGSEGSFDAHGLTYDVQPEDTSVSTEFVNADGDRNTLSLSSDGLIFTVMAGEETTTWTISPDEISDGSRLDTWSELIVLQ